MLPWLFLVAFLLISKSSGYSQTCATSNECKETTIDCPANESCDIICSGYNACYKAKINGTLSTSLNINCVGGTSSSSCIWINIYCPSNDQGTKKCVITADDALHDQFKLYAVNSWNDIDIIYSGTYFLSSLGWGQMYCTNGYASNCYIQTNAWKCAEDTALCNNPPTSAPISSTTIAATPIPITSTPTTDTPTTAMPTTNIPTTDTPTTEMPTTGTPTTDTPTTETPTTDTPTTAIPTTAIPTTDIPTTSIPTTMMPSTSSPTKSTLLSTNNAITTTTYTNCVDENSVILSVSFDYTLQNNMTSTTEITNTLSNIADSFIKNEINKLPDCNVLDSKVNIQLNSNLKNATINTSICFDCNDDNKLNIQFAEIDLEKDFIETVQKSQNASNPILKVVINSTNINVEIIINGHDGEVDDDPITTKYEPISNNDTKKANYSILIVIVGVTILSLLCCMFFGFMYIRNRRKENEIRQTKIEKVASVSMVSIISTSCPNTPIPHTTTSHNTSYGSDNTPSGNLQTGTDGTDHDDDIYDMNPSNAVTPRMGPSKGGEFVDTLDMNMNEDDEGMYTVPTVATPKGIGNEMDVTAGGDDEYNETPIGAINEDQNENENYDAMYCKPDIISQTSQ